MIFPVAFVDLENDTLAALQRMSATCRTKSPRLGAWLYDAASTELSRRRMTCPSEPDLVDAAFNSWTKHELSAALGVAHFLRSRDRDARRVLRAIHFFLDAAAAMHLDRQHREDRLAQVAATGRTFWEAD